MPGPTASTPSISCLPQPQISGTVVKILISNGFEVEVERELTVEDKL